MDIMQCLCFFIPTETLARMLYELTAFIKKYRACIVNKENQGILIKLIKIVTPFFFLTLCLKKRKKGYMYYVHVRKYGF